MILIELQKWIEAQSDGDWEHEHSIKMETIDNPGWNISIPIFRTSLEGYIYEDKTYHDEMDWYEILSDGNYFTSNCSLNRIDYVLSFFLNDFFKKSNRTNVFYSVFYRYVRENSLELFLPLEAYLIDYKTFIINSIEPDFISNIKVKSIEDFELFKKDEERGLINAVSHVINKKVNCKLEMLFDYPALVVCDLVF